MRATEYLSIHIQVYKNTSIEFTLFFSMFFLQCTSLLSLKDFRKNGQVSEIYVMTKKKN